MSQRRAPEKRKVQKECALLYFLAYNPHSKQSIHFLKYSLIPQQYKVLQELAVNDLAHNLPEYNQKKRKGQLHLALKIRIQRLAEGKLKREKLHHLYPIIQLWAQHALRYHDLCP